MNERPITRDLSASDFQLGDWWVRPELHRLQNDETSLHLEPRLVNLLVFFAHNPRTVLSKEELFDTIWQSQFVADSALTRSVAELRRALGDNAHQPRYIETIPKRGYRLVAPVQMPKKTDRFATVPSAPVAAEAAAAVPGAVAVGAPVEMPPSNGHSSMSCGNSEGQQPATRQRSARIAVRVAIFLTLLGLLLTGLSLTGFDLNPVVETTPAPRVRSLAVLPFQDLSDPPLDSNFTTAITDALTNDLAQLDAVRVVSLRAVEQIQNEGASLERIARELGVDAVVEGSLLRQDGQQDGQQEPKVRITLQLTEAATASHLWAGSYEAELDEVLEVQEKAAAEIAQAAQP